MKSEISTGYKKDKVEHPTVHNIELWEVEKVLEDHKDVVNAIVIGTPDKRVGEMLIAFITLKKGCIPNNDLKRELAWHAQSEVGPMVLFKNIEFRDFPSKTGDLKAKKLLLKEKALAQEFKVQNSNQKDTIEEPEGSRDSSSQTENVTSTLVIVDDVRADGKELQISAHRISSREVANVILSHPYVSDAAVVCVPDERNGEVLKAFVKLKKGALPSNDLKLELAWHVMAELKPIMVFKNIDLEEDITEATGDSFPDEIGEEISIQGRTLLSEDIEKALLSHGSVSDAVVLGISGEKHGKALIAFVTLRKGVLPSDELRKELARHVRTQIGSEAVFKAINFREFLPKAKTRIMLRHILRADVFDKPTNLSVTVAD